MMYNMLSIENLLQVHLFDDFSVALSSWHLPSGKNLVNSVLHAFRALDNKKMQLSAITARVAIMSSSRPSLQELLNTSYLFAKISFLLFVNWLSLASKG